MTECYNQPTYGIFFWTAGQRRDPNTKSTFVWKDSTRKSCGSDVCLMEYTNWSPGDPNYYDVDGTREACGIMLSNRSYKWADYVCTEKVCALCEIELPGEP